MERIHVANVQEAVELASRYKDEGRCDWFRGQTLERTPYAALVRMRLRGDEAAIAHNTRRISMFCRWLAKTPQLEHLLEPQHGHQLFAILQHYGVPTFYLDFSTDPGVAGFFACDTNDPPTSGVSCIYYLNTEDLKHIWEVVGATDERKEAQIEPVVVDVKNLWRLQAQAGVFLYANYNWDVDYPMDRIVFPYTGYPAAPTKDRIYPKERSALEQLLDQYFDIERTTFFNEKQRKMVAYLKSRGSNASYSVMNTFDRGVYAPAFRDAAALQELASWNESALAAWHVVPDEKFHETVGRTLRLQLGSDPSPKGTGDAVRYGVIQSLRSMPSLRSHAIEFVIERVPAGVDVAELAALLQRAWNGMRTLPFTTEDIGDCLGRIATLHALGFANMATHTGSRSRCLAANFGRAQQVAFGPKDGAGTQAWGTAAEFIAALRKDMRELLTDEHRQRSGDIEDLFRVIYNPRLMFEFELFKRLFARELIPIQVLDRRSFILFNPATVNTFGNP